MFLIFFPLNCLCTTVFVLKFLFLLNIVMLYMYGGSEGG
ncbi:hypothetical protein KSS87_000391 [Heliosperma pusillum]|nr:hypothetical protein KSS87_004718 [Heliosperma pusillum]KAH9611448.1 hypothetical protein KSS87_000391 [Heliosperma pusillum]